MRQAGAKCDNRATGRPAARRPGPARVALLAATGLVVIGAAWAGWRLAARGTGGPQPPRRAPNIVLISVDMLRPDHMGCYGYHRPTSPRMDRLAAEGALFEQAVSSTSWTLPAHAALFTGLADSVHGCLDTDRPLHADHTTLAERLRARGYATAGFFSGPYLHPVFGLGQGFEAYEDCTSYARRSAELAAETGAVDGPEIWRASHDDVTSPHVYAAVHAWLTANRRRPFFLFVHLWDVHFDFIPPPPYDTLFDPDYRGWVTGRHFLNDRRINRDMPARDREHLLALYDGEIAWTDAHVGRILDDLDALGLRDTTLVVLLSDHGSEFFEHGLKAHRQTLYDEVVRIPLIVRCPGRIAPGTRASAQVSIIDVAPTILELAGLDAPADVMGRSLVPLLAGGEWAESDPAVCELFCDAGQLRPDGTWAPDEPRFPIRHRLRAFRRSGHKLIHDLNREQTLVFDLAADPGEQRPLADPDSPLVQAALRDAEDGRAWLADFADLARQAYPNGSLPPEVLKQLTGLGYLGGSGTAPRPPPATRPADEPGTQPATPPATAPAAPPADAAAAPAGQGAPPAGRGIGSLSRWSVTRTGSRTTA